MAIISMMFLLAVPATRDALTVNDLKKATRQLIGLERQLRVDAVREQVDYLLHLDIPHATYYVTESSMTPEKQDEIKKNAKKLPDGVAIADIVTHEKKKITDGIVKVKFGSNHIGSPLVIHLREDEERMTLVMNPFLGVTAVYDHYAEISPDDGLGQDADK
jgi:general secretion pathway protein H